MKRIPVISKGRDGWTSQTDLPMPDGHTLRIWTGKTYAGGVSTTARAGTIDGFFFTRAYGSATTSDFGQTITHVRAARCTQKTVHEQHAAALMREAELIENAELYYAGRAALAKAAQ